MRIFLFLLALASACAAPGAGAPATGGQGLTSQGAAAGSPGGFDAGTALAAQRPERPSASITKPLEAYVGRMIWLGAPGAQPEQWLLREIGQDHVKLERSRTYRVLPARRIAEITWTELTGFDPTPRIVLAPE